MTKRFIASAAIVATLALAALTAGTTADAGGFGEWPMFKNQTR